MRPSLNARDALAQTVGRSLSIRISAGLIAPDTVDEEMNLPDATGYVRLRIADNGKGLDEATRVQIFDPFFTSKAVDEGTGLGLSTVFGIVQQHQGHIECQSQPDAGATFTVYIPMTEHPVARSVEVEMPTEPTSVPATNPATILLVDDDEVIIKGVGRLLEQQGYKVLVGRDGQEGLEAYQSHARSIDLVILDLSLPKLSGQEVLEEISRLDPSAKVIIFTGYSSGKKIFSDQVVEVIQKPPQCKFFLKRIGELLSV